MLFEIVSLPFLAYLRHYLTSFNKKTDGQLPGQEEKGGVSWEKGTLGDERERERDLSPGDMS